MNKLLYVPNTIQIEFVEGCNRRCEFCGTMGMNIEKLHYMKPETLQKIVLDIKRLKWHSMILLACHGEPTLHPYCLEFIQYIRKELPKQRITMMTNGFSILRDITMIKKLLDAGINNLILDEYKDNPILDKIKDYVKENNVELIVGGTTKLFGTKKIIQVNPPLELNNTSITRKLVNHCGAGMEPLKEPLERKCARVFREMLIRYDGNVAICCNDFRGEYPIANVNEMPLENVWMHPRFESARKFLYTGCRKFNPCNKCNALPIREGLLPDHMGKATMPKPTVEDWNLVNTEVEPLCKIRKRAWEE